MRAINLVVNVLLHLFSVLFITTPVKSQAGAYYIQFEYMGSNFYTRIVVSGRSLLGTRLPLIVLHGGPGLTCDYMLPIANLTDTHQIPVILYDQIGNGHSTHIQDAPLFVWTMDLFVAQLESVINYFQIGSSFALLGHGWGSTLALEFAARKRPAGLRALILSDGLASMPLYGQSMGQLLQEFPASVQQGFAGGFSNPAAFEAAFRTFFAVHGLRISPQPAEEATTLAYLFGSNEIKGDHTVAAATGLNPPDWSIIDRLPTITTPTLVINGRYSVSQDFVIQPFIQFLPTVKWVRFENSAQMPWWEEPALYMDTVGGFISSLHP